VPPIEINGWYANYMSKFLGERTFTRAAIADDDGPLL
jgi:hypothetical protein